VQGSTHHFLQAQNKAAAINENKAMINKGQKRITYMNGVLEMCVG
jgi:hypothetical protein